MEKGKQCSSEEVDAQDLSTHCLGAWDTRTGTLVPSECSWLTVQPGQAETLEPMEEHRVELWEQAQMGSCLFFKSTVPPRVR